jgi:[ribosomal protein S5]-alanine N-acetyltransferase
MRPGADPVTTERLTLRRFTADDLDLLDALNSDPEVTRYTSGPISRERSAEMLRVRILEYYDQHPGLGIWATLERATGECVGMHLINHIRDADEIQVGYLLYPRFWGRGYATEMCRALVRYGFHELRLPQIVGITDLPHVASQKVLEKCGLRRAGERCFSAYADGAPLAYFARDRDDWLAEHGLA